MPQSNLLFSRLFEINMCILFKKKLKNDNVGSWKKRENIIALIRIYRKSWKSLIHISMTMFLAFRLISPLNITIGISKRSLAVT